jgi:hypothetical protein
MTGIKIEHDDAIMAGGIPASRGPAMRLLLVIWSALVDGAAMYGAAVHGYYSPEHFRSDGARPTDNE